MYFLLSGEGATDIGCPRSDLGDRLYNIDQWHLGPISYFIDAEVQKIFKYSPIDCKAMYFLPETVLKKISKGLTSLPRCHKHHAYYMRNAQALTAAAQYLHSQTETPVVPVLFRDTDGTRNSPALRHEELRVSIKRPFKYPDITVCPMLPKPKFVRAQKQLPALRPARGTFW